MKFCVCSRGSENGLDSQLSPLEIVFLIYLKKKKTRNRQNMRNLRVCKPVKTASVVDVVIFYVYCNSHYDNNCVLLLLIKLKDSFILINIFVFYIIAKDMLKNKRNNT